MDIEKRNKIRAKLGVEEAKSPTDFVVGIPLAGPSFAEQRRAYWRLEKEGGVKPTFYHDPTLNEEYEAILTSIASDAPDKEAE